MVWLCAVLMMGSGAMADPQGIEGLEDDTVLPIRDPAMPDTLLRELLTPYAPEGEE